MNKTIQITQELVSQHFISGTSVETGWFVSISPAMTPEQEHRAVIGVMEMLVGGVPERNGIAQLEYAPDSKMGYRNDIGKFGVIINKEKKVVAAMPLYFA